MTYQSINPYDSTLMQTFQGTTDDGLEAALANKKLVRVASMDAPAYVS